MIANVIFFVIGAIAGLLAREVIETIRVTRPDPKGLPPASEKDIQRAQKRCKADLSHALRNRDRVLRSR